MNKKAFSGILVLLIIFTLTSLAINNLVNINFEPTYNTSFIQTKNKLSNYYILTNQAAQNCFLEETQNQTKNCINNIYTDTLNELNMGNNTFYNCKLEDFEELGPNTFSNKLNCNINLESSGTTLFSNIFSTNIIIRKSN